MRFRKPQLIPLIFIILASVTLFGLGFWQLARLDWKNQQLALIQAAQEQPTLGTLPPSLDDVMYRNVNLTGTFLNDHVFQLVGGKQHEAPGYFQLTPFRLDDDGRIVLVNRGFAPIGKETKVEGIQQVQGIIRPLRMKRMFMPSNHPDKNIWFYEDLPAMSALAGGDLLPLTIEVTGTHEKGVYPIPSEGKIILRNDHLHYAITWFTVGIIGLIMFAVYHREKKA